MLELQIIKSFIVSDILKYLILIHGKCMKILFYLLLGYMCFVKCENK